MLNQRRRQWPRMKYDHVVTSAFSIPGKYKTLKQYWANSEPTWLTMDQR